MSCEFSSSIVGTNSIFSPSSKFIACINEASRVTVRDPNTLEILHIFQCIDKIEKYEFSPDSDYIQCAMYSRNAIQIFSLSDKAFKCRINEGVAGMINSWWSPDSRTVVIESDFGIQLSFWSLVDSTSSIIALPKPSISLGKNIPSQILAYSDISSYLAVVHRIELADHIGVYAHEGSSLKELTKFKARSNDISCIRFLPGDTHIVTLDSPLNYKLCVYTVSGEIVCNFEAYQHALGIRSLALPPLQPTAKDPSSSCSALIAIGSFDGKVRVLSAYSWQLAFTLPLSHPRELKLLAIEGSDLLITTEVVQGANGTVSTGGLNDTFMTTSNTMSLASTTALRNANKGIAYAQRTLKALPRLTEGYSAKSSSSYPPMGASWVGFSSDGSLLAARDEAHPRCLWVWYPSQCRLEALIVQLESITCAAWRPAAEDDEEDAPPLLALCGGNSRVYFWNPVSGSTWADVSTFVNEKSDTESATETAASVFSRSTASTASFGGNPSVIHSLEWNSKGTHLLLRGKESHMTCEVNLNSLIQMSTGAAVSEEEHQEETKVRPGMDVLRESHEGDNALVSKYREMRSTVTLDEEDDEDYL